jgi:signal transduction histidine kinase
MPRFSFFSISLAAKCRLLFGIAVLLIVSSTLFVPWLRMRDLVHETNLQTARLTGKLALARSNLSSGNWDVARKALEQWWPAGAERYGFLCPVPRLIALSDPSAPKAPAWVDEYVAGAIEELARDPGLNEATPTVMKFAGEMIYRVVIPVRSAGGRHPLGALLGVISVEYPVGKARLELLVNLGLSLMAGALAGVLAVLVFYLITQKLILSPVRELKRVAESVSQGDHEVRSQIATGDEYEELARAFNAMLSHLQASENELRTINKSLDTRLGELAERNVALFEADKVKNQFLANVSHELRTPLTSIIGFAELLREAASAEGGRILRYSENIMSSGRLLLGIINDLLDLAKIEAGKLELHLGEVNMVNMCTNLLDFMRPLADKKSLQLVASLDETAPSIVSDAGRIQQILYNLLSNSVKFTPDGGRIELRMQGIADGGISVSVSDTGIGIAPQELPKLFEKFRQLDDSMTREHSGTGLGLAISRELVTMLGGRITVESEANKGSMFTVKLPAATAGQVVASYGQMPLND